MNLHHLYYFRILARTEHYTKAAEILHMTQPSLSHAISNLEDELGVPLFEKQGRNVVLSTYGKAFIPYVDNVLNEIESGTKKMQELSENANSVISLAFLYTLSSDFIPNLIKGFLSEKGSKNIKFILSESCTTTDECTTDLIEGLKSGKYDFIFVNKITDDPDIEFCFTYEQNYVALLPKGHPLTINDEVDLLDTVDYPFIQYTNKYGTKREINKLFKKINVIPNTYCEVEDEASMAGLVSSNIGIAIAPYKSSFEYFDIDVLPIKNPKFKRPIYLGFIKDRKMTSRFNNFIEYVVNNAYRFK